MGLLPSLFTGNGCCRATTNSSDLAGLNETVENKKTGLLFTTGDHIDLAEKIEFLADNIETRDVYSANGKERVKNNFTLDIQKNNLIRIITNVLNR